MTIERTLTAIIGRCEALLANMPAYREARELLEPSPLRASRTDGQRSSKGDHSDPTVGSVLTVLADQRGEDFTDAVIAARTTLDWAFDVQREDIASTRRRPRADKDQRDHEAGKRDIQCHAVDNDKRCGNNYVVSPEPGNKFGGLCDKHIKRVQRSEQGVLAQAVGHVIETARFEHRATVEPMAPMRLPRHRAAIKCRLCEWVCEDNGEDEHGLRAGLEAALADHDAEHHA